MIRLSCKTLVPIIETTVRTANVELEIYLYKMQLTFTTGRVINEYHHIAHALSPGGVPKEINSLGSEGSLTPYLLTERTLKQYCLPFTRSNTGNLGEFTTMSRLASSQLFFPARD